MTTEVICVPDIGTGEGEVIEILVNVGDNISAEQGLLTLESNKASMEIPAPKAGVVKSIKVKLGDRLKEGDALLELEIDNLTEPAVSVLTDGEPETPIIKSSVQAAEPLPAEQKKEAPALSKVMDVTVPDIGSASNARVIELLVAKGDKVEQEQSLLTLESDKASMEIPSPVSGEVVEVLIKLDAQVGEGDLICRIRPSEATSGSSDSTMAESETEEPEEAVASQQIRGGSASVAPASQPCRSGDGRICVHAGPAVRLLAREFGVDLTAVKPTGPRQRILKEDVQHYVKNTLQKQRDDNGQAQGTGIQPIPEVDFSRFGDLETVPMTRLQQIGTDNLHRSWLNVPHVTQFERADITDLEAFRIAQKPAAENAGTKLTVLPFLLKACAHLLKEMPEFNSSLAANGKALIMKKYVHLGFAVDTPDGLLVPVIRDVDQKNLLQLAVEAADLANKARHKKLGPAQMQGACLTISSLGHIGGIGFTPIVNAPEVAILGVSRATIQPVWDGTEFAPRLMLPLSLSYDHRVINGAAAARFTRRLSEILAEIRSLLL